METESCAARCPMCLLRSWAVARPAPWDRISRRRAAAGYTREPIPPTPLSARGRRPAQRLVPAHGHSRRLVDAVPFARRLTALIAESADAESRIWRRRRRRCGLPWKMSKPQSGAFYPTVSRRSGRQPQPAMPTRCRPRWLLRQLLYSLYQAQAFRFLVAGSSGAAIARSGGGAAGRQADSQQLPAAKRPIWRSDRQCGGGRHPGSFAARPDRRDPGRHRGSKRDILDYRSSASRRWARSPAPTSRPRRPCWPRPQQTLAAAAEAVGAAARSACRRWPGAIRAEGLRTDSTSPRLHPAGAICR